MLKSLENYLPPTTDPVTRYIKPNADTAFGKAHGFTEIETYQDFKQAIPLQTYADHEPFITRTAAGEKNELTAETPVAFELTSGTSSATKLIPITPTFQTELASALNLWMQSWQKRVPQVFDGPAYWSISPRLGQLSQHGLDDDGAYFPDEVRAGLADWLLIPEAFDFTSTARALLDEPDLRSVSVWSPTFLLKIDEALDTTATWKEIWPNLNIVSCWADAQAAMWKERVVERLGDASIFEPKGLLATEGVTSIPCGGINRLATGVHFHEFIDCDSKEILTKPQFGKRYETVLTTGSGLYRYRTSDMIEIGNDGHITFIGRTGNTSDLVGEKIDPEQVINAFRAANSSGFVRVGHLHYEIWATNQPQSVLAELRSNPHFAAALDNGQLSPSPLHQLPPDWQSTATRHLAQTRNARESDVKLPALERNELAEIWRS